MQYTFLYLLGQLAALTFAAQLQNAPLSSSLDYLHDALVEYLPLPTATVVRWSPGWIPVDCQSVAYAKKFFEIDIEVYDVHYTDCDAPWILCRHKDSPNPISYLIDRFGRVPVRSRSYVRHVVDLPDLSPSPNTNAYSDNDNIVLINKADTILAVLVHETGHSLDGHGVFQKKQGQGRFSDTRAWSDAIGKDSKVPDGYAQSNTAEDVAQNIVVAAYDLNVPGGLPKVQKDWKTIYNQYSLIKTLANEAGQAYPDPGNILKSGGRCGKRLTNSQPVRAVKPILGKGAIQARGRDQAPDVSLPDHIEVIEPLAFGTEVICNHP